MARNICYILSISQRDELIYSIDRDILIVNGEIRLLYSFIITNLSFLEIKDTKTYVEVDVCVL